MRELNVISLQWIFMINTWLNVLAENLILIKGHNRLNGAIPSELGAFNNLEDLDLGEWAMDIFLEEQ